MDVQNGQVSCARHPETKCLLENEMMLEKKNKVKTQFGDVFLDEIHRKGKESSLQSNQLESVC